MEAWSGVVFSAFLWVVGILLFAIIVGGISLVVIIKKRDANYKDMVVIWRRNQEKQEGKKDMPIIVGIDRGAVLYDKKIKQWTYHIKKWNINLGMEEGKGGGTTQIDEDRDLDIPSIPWEGGRNCVFVEQLGSRKAAIAKPFLFSGEVKVIVSQADVAEAKRAFELAVKTFGKKPNMMLQMLPFIIACVLTLVLLIVLIQKFEILKDVALALKDAATIIKGGGAIAVT